MLWFEAIGITLFVIGILAGIGYLGERYPKALATVLIFILVTLLIFTIHFLLSIRQ